jgi:hypothetical protein
MQLKAIAILAAVSSAVAQRPTDVSICDYYTTALLKENTAANQKTLLTLVVNTAVIGNYTEPNVGIAVPGVLNPDGEFNGTKVNLLPYFNGGLKSTNRGGSSGVAVNFLDGGGAAPLMKNKAADDEKSNQLLVFFFLNCFKAHLLGLTDIFTACSSLTCTSISAFFSAAPWKDRMTTQAIMVNQAWAAFTGQSARTLSLFISCSNHIV